MSSIYNGEGENFYVTEESIYLLDHTHIVIELKNYARYQYVSRIRKNNINTLYCVYLKLRFVSQI